jgi:hypothetical protein
MFQLKITCDFNFFWLQDECFECGAAREAGSAAAEIQAKFEGWVLD